MSSRRLWTLLAMVLCAIYLFATHVTDAAGTTIDLMGMLQKVPAMLPFLLPKLETEECKTNLRNFKDEFESVVGPSATPGKNSVSGMRQALCKVPSNCIGEVVGAIKKMAATGGFMEKMINKMLESKGLDLETADILVRGYVENLCSTETTDEEVASQLDEL